MTKLIKSQWGKKGKKKKKKKRRSCICPREWEIEMHHKFRQTAASDAPVSALGVEAG